jgi:4-alpha-glucanotransferase
MAGKVQWADPEALKTLLRLLGEGHLESKAQILKAIQSRRQAIWSRWVEPVRVVWEGDRLVLDLRLPEGKADQRIDWHLFLESGADWSGRFFLDRVRPSQVTRVGSRRYGIKRVVLTKRRLPLGYHRLCVRWNGRKAEVLVISAPLKGYPLLGMPDRKGWGIFTPLYAIPSHRNWGAGDLTDLKELIDWAADLGAEVVMTLPLFALFLEKPFEPSPYAPISRLFLSEFWIDPTRLPEWSQSPKAQTYANSKRVLQRLHLWRESGWVDYQAQLRCKRHILRLLAETFYRLREDRRQAFQDFLNAHPEAVHFARFRANKERVGPSSIDWRTHLYAQWAIHEQLRDVVLHARRRGIVLALDLPLGVHPEGYDVWRWKDLFPSQIALGAPPDTFFTEGQDWGFPPIDPDRLREDGYRYWRDVLSHSMRMAGLIRIDHVMAFHRLFWIPHGFLARQGVYRTYPSEEWYAVLTLESHRNRCAVVGENLGTVPSQVHRALKRHGLMGLFVLQYEVRPDPESPLTKPHRDVVASFNTHDMPPFHAFLTGRDIHWRRKMQLLDASEALAEYDQRQRVRGALECWLKKQGEWTDGLDSDQGIWIGCWRWLAKSSARLVQLSLEDLLGETEPQNIPGTGLERPNWRRKWRCRWEEVRQDLGIRRMLDEVNRLRCQKKDCSSLKKT